MPELKIRAGEPVGAGCRVIPPQELAIMALDPAFQAAVDLIERVQEKETGIKRMIRKQLRHDLMMNETLFRNKRLIDRARETIR